MRPNGLRSDVRGEIARSLGDPPGAPGPKQTPASLAVCSANPAACPWPLPSPFTSPATRSRVRVLESEAGERRVALESLCEGDYALIANQVAPAHSKKRSRDEAVGVRPPSIFRPTTRCELAPRWWRADRASCPSLRLPNAFFSFCA